jgi:hypothetical protein
MDRRFDLDPMKSQFFPLLHTLRTPREGVKGEKWIFFLFYKGLGDVPQRFFSILKFNVFNDMQNVVKVVSMEMGPGSLEPQIQGHVLE